ncbi:MAG: VWA domain-containing protein [Planctomycetota bacterium]
MTWATPLIAAIAAAIAIPALIILYFLKLRRRTVEVSTTLLWRQAIEDLQANAPFQKLRKNLLLLLQLLILAAALFALAQPEFQSSESVGQRHIILIDTSASMTATDGDTEDDDDNSRLAEAKERALVLVDSLRDAGLFVRDTADEAMVIAFSASAQVRQTFTSDKDLLRRAIEGIQATDAVGELEEAFVLAKAHAPTRKYVDDRDGQVYDLGLSAGVPATLHVFSDGRLADADRVLPGPEDTVVYHPVGATTSSNLAITGLRAERSFDTPENLSVFVGVQSTITQPATADVELLIDGVVERISTITLPPARVDPSLPVNTPPTPTVTGAVFRLTRAESAVVAVNVRLNDDTADSASAARDVLSTDDRGWLVVPAARRASVAIVTTGAFYLRPALEALPLAKLDEFTPEQWEDRAASSAGETPYDVVVLDRYLPAAPAGQSMPPGRYLVLGAAPQGPAAFEPPIEQGAATVIEWRRDHPALSGVLLDNLLIGEMPETRPGPDSTATALIETDKGPALYELADADARALVAPFDPAASTWPFDVGFVVFLAQSINYLAQGDAEVSARDDALRPGRVLTTRLPIGAEEVTIRTPAGDTASVPVGADSRVVYGPLSTVGLYELTWSGPSATDDARVGSRALRPLAVNLLDPSESDVFPASTIRLATGQAEVNNDRDAQTRRALWPWLMLAALAIMLLEWFIYNRKVYL